MADSKRVNRWLESKQTQALLGKLARTIASDLRGSRILPPFLESWGADPEDVIPVLKSELALFVLEDRSRIQAMILAEDRNLPRYLHHAFLNHCLDLVRRTDIDPLRYFRKRAGEVLRQASSIHTSLRGERYVMFSIHPENTDEKISTEIDLCSIPLPPKLAHWLDYDMACKKDVLEKLALHFWQRLSSACGGKQIWVDLRDFVQWVGCYVPLKLNVASEQEADRRHKPISESPGTRGPEPSLSEMQPLPRPGTQQIMKMAGCFAARLNSKDLSVFYHRFFEQASWDEVARMTGFSGPSGPHYRYEQILDRLKAFLREWPGLSPEDEDPETMDLFREALRSILKESLPES